jgi:tol-pal system protein YbgF
MDCLKSAVIVWHGVGMNWAKYLFGFGGFSRRSRALSGPRFAGPAGTILYLLALAVSGGFGPANAQESSYAQQLQRLRQDLRDIQKYVYSESFSGTGKIKRAAPGGPPSSADAATRLHFKIQSMETELTALTGRLEQIENGLQRSEGRLNRLVSDVDLRLRTLETASGISPSVESNVEAGVSSDNGTGVQALILSGGTDAAPAADPGNGQLPPGQKLLGTVPNSAVINVKPSQTVPNTAQPSGKIVLKRPPLPVTATAPGSGFIAKPSGKVMLLPDGTPKQQYKYAFGLLKKRDFSNAARSFKAFVDKNPKHSLAGNAMYWLGETHYDQKQYAEAARIFLDGYRRYPKSNKAPDNLLKLGKSLNSVGEKKSACAAWNKLLKSYPKANSRLVRSAKRSFSQNKCA